MSTQIPPSKKAPVFAAPPARNTSGGGEGMDRKIEKRLITPQRIAMASGALLLLVLIGYAMSAASGGSRLNVQEERLTISTVQSAPFQEFIAVTGTVLPRSTIFLDAVEGGRVEEVFVMEGASVERGQPLLRLSNSSLQLSLISNEAALAEQINNLQAMRFQIEQNRLNLQQQLMQMEYDIVRLNRQHARNLELHERQLVSQAEFEATRDELTYLQRRQGLTVQAFRQDSLAQEARMAQMETSVDRMRQNFALVQQSLDNLTVRAPVTGQLSLLNAEIGELRPPGSRLGQVDIVDGFRLRAAIDEFYIARVVPGQRATTQALGGIEHEMTITRVYPEVRDGRFEIDLEFVDAAPADIRRGQTVRLRLELGDPAEAVLLARGGFYQATGGNWVYVLAADGREAVRRPIRLGRQNPQFFEVLDGLEPGDQVVTSGYDTFGDAARLILR
jgi:HlyD family secretion protein